VLNVRLGQGLSFTPADEVEGGRGLGVGDHDLGVGQVDPHPVRMVAEDLDPYAVGLQDGGDQVGVDALAPEDDGPAFDAHSINCALGGVCLRGRPHPALPIPGFAGTFPACGEVNYQFKDGSTVVAWRPRVVTP
jgi:hypothetical protein